MKPKTHNKTKKIRGGRKQTGGFLDDVFWKKEQSSETNPQPASSKPWWKFWESSTTNNTPINETANPVVQEEDSPTKTKTEELSDSNIDPKFMNGGRRRKRRQKRTKKKSKSKSKAKTT